MGCKLAEWEGDSCCGSGHYGMSLKEESAEEERREHTMFPCNAVTAIHTGWFPGAGSCALGVKVPKSGVAKRHQCLVGDWKNLQQQSFFRPVLRRK